MKNLILFLVVIQTINAGDINIVHLAGDQPATITVTAEKKSQTMEIQPRDHSGSFTLPNAATVVKLTEPKGPDLTIPAGKTPQIAILHEQFGKPAWHLCVAQAKTGKNSLRVLNLSDAEQSINFEGTDHVIAAGKILDLGETDSPAIKLALNKAKPRSVKPEEPCAYIAVIHNSEKTAKLHFIADR